MLPKVIILTGLVAVTAGCARATPPAGFVPAPHNAADRVMAQFAELFLDRTLALDPILASYVGYHKWDRRLPDYSEAGIERARATLRDLERGLARIDSSQLSPAYALDHDIVAHRLRELRFFFETLEPYTWDVQLYNQAIGGGMYYLTLPPEDERAWPVRLKALLDRLEALPAFLNTAEDRLQNPPRVFTEFVLSQTSGNLNTLQKSLPPLFENFPDLQPRFASIQPEAVAALEDFQQFLQEDLLPRSTGDWRLGEARWSQKLQITLTATTARLYPQAEAGLNATRAEMYDVALPLFQAAYPQNDAPTRLAGEARINHVVGKVLADASQHHGTAESFVKDVKQDIAEITQFIESTDFLDLPPKTDNFVIEPTPPFLDGLAVAFYNPAPAFEPDLKKSYWISTVPTGNDDDAKNYLREYNDYILQALTIHEAFPGHYVQFYWSSHADVASVTKRVLESGTMAEGWACMIEQLMHEAGYKRGDPRFYLMHLKMRLRLFINAMLDERLHTSPAPEADLDAWALNLMITQGFQEKAEALRKLRRAKLTSTQLSTYFVGYSQMLQLFRDGQKKGGPQFNQKRFLMKMMSYGTISPPMIRKLMAQEGWL